MRPTTSRAIAERAQTQLGHITRPQLTELGLSAKAIRGLVAHGFEPVGQRTFRLPGLPARSSETSWPHASTPAAPPRTEQPPGSTG